MTNILEIDFFSWKTAFQCFVCSILWQYRYGIFWNEEERRSYIEQILDGFLEWRRKAKLHWTNPRLVLEISSFCGKFRFLYLIGEAWSIYSLWIKGFEHLLFFSREKNSCLDLFYESKLTVCPATLLNAWNEASEWIKWIQMTLFLFSNCVRACFI